MQDLGKVSGQGLDWIRPLAQNAGEARFVMATQCLHEQGLAWGYC